MANFKIVISDPKSRKAFQKEIEQKASGFMGKRITEKVKGEPLGLAGYEFEVTGGSDAQGFPMRKDVEGMARKRILLSHGPGFHPDAKGQRKRKSVRGNTISSSTSQINVKIVTYGSKPLKELVGKTEKKKELTEEERKKKLQEELSSKVEEKAPEKSRSDQILEEQAMQEKAEKEAPEKGKALKEKETEPPEEKPKEEPSRGGPSEEPKQEEKPAEPEEPKHEGDKPTEEKKKKD